MFQTAASSLVKPIRKGPITDEVISEVRLRTDIVQVIGEYVRLTSSGKDFRALCPIHKEKTPSFFVVPQKQIFHCFGCGKGGDVFRFLMEIERLSFPDAVLHLAQKCGVTIRQEADPESQKRAEVHAFLDEITDMFSARLLNTGTGGPARQYLKKRGIKPETAQSFKIGFAPPGWEFLSTKYAKIPERLEILKRVGLIKIRANGTGCYDAFRNRLIIPILDGSGRVAGFGGRVIDPQDEPKYLNSSDSEFFSKGKMLFNLRGAQNEIRRRNAAIIVEGYMDVISLVQGGIENAVASLGTAITPDQIQLLARNCDRVYLCYDADTAGQKATLKAINLQRDTHISARVISFEDPKDDPDSFIQREGSQAFLKRLEQARDIYSFIIESRTKGLAKPFDIPTKEKLVSELKEFVPSIHSKVAKSEFLKNISHLLDVDSAILDGIFFEGKTLQAPNKPMESSPSGKGAQIKLQEWIIKHLLETPQEIDKAQNLLSAKDFSDPRLKKIYEAICQKYEAMGSALKPAEILLFLEDPALASRLSEILVSLENQPVQPLKDCLQALVKQRLIRESARIAAEIRAADQKGNAEEITRLTLQHTQLKHKLEVLNKNF